MVQTADGVTRPGVRFPRRTQYKSRLLFHWRATDLLLGHDPGDQVLKAVTGETPTFTRATVGGYTTDRFGRLRRWAQGMPRIEMSDVASDGLWEQSGQLFETLRANLLVRSEELDQVWTKTRATITIDQHTAPDGVVSADRLVEDTTASSTHHMQQPFTITADADGAFSFHAAVGTRTFIVLEVFETAASGNNIRQWFNLSTGAVGATSEANGTGVLTRAYIRQLADGWYRCVLVGGPRNGATAVTARVYLATSDTAGGITYTGDGVSYVPLWGGQAEDSAKLASSYIKTLGSNVTRNADDLSYAVTFGRRDLTIASRVTVPLSWLDVADTGIFHGIAGLGDADTSEWLELFTKVNTTYVARLGQGGATTGTVITEALPAATRDLAIVGQYDHANARIRLDPGTGVFGAWTSVTPLAEDFTIIRIGNSSGANYSEGPLIWVKVAPGLQTAAEIGKLL